MKRSNNPIRFTVLSFVLAVVTALPVLPAVAQGPNGEEPRPKRGFENGEAPERRGPGLRQPGSFRGGDRGGERGDRQRPEGFKPDFDRYLKTLEQHDPEEAKRLTALKESDDKDAFNGAMRKHFEGRKGGQWMGKGGASKGGMGMFRKPNPKLDAIRGRLRTALQAHHADPSDDTEAALRKVIEEEFDEDCADHQRHIDKLEEVLTKMKAGIADQRARRDDHVDQRLKRALELRLHRGGSGKGPGDGPHKK